MNRQMVTGCVLVVASLHFGCGKYKTAYSALDSEKPQDDVSSEVKPKANRPRWIIAAKSGQSFRTTDYFLWVKEDVKSTFYSAEGPIDFVEIPMSFREPKPASGSNTSIIYVPLSEVSQVKKVEGFLTFDVTLSDGRVLENGNFSGTRGWVGKQSGQETQVEIGDAVDVNFIHTNNHINATVVSTKRGELRLEDVRFLGNSEPRRTRIKGDSTLRVKAAVGKERLIAEDQIRRIDFSGDEYAKGRPVSVQLKVWKHRDRQHDGRASLYSHL